MRSTQCVFYEAKIDSLEKSGYHSVALAPHTKFHACMQQPLFLPACIVFFLAKPPSWGREPLALTPSHHTSHRPPQAHPGHPTG